MISVEQLCTNFPLGRTARALGTEFIGSRHADGTRLVMPANLAASLYKNLEVVDVIGRIAAYVGVHDNFYGGPSLQRAFKMRRLGEPIPAGERTLRGITTSLYHDPAAGCIVKTFDVPAPHEGITQFAVMASLADQLPSGRLRVPTQYALIQSAHSFHQTVVMEAVGGDVLSQTVYSQYSDVALHIQQLQQLIASEVPKHLQPYINDATDHQSNFIHGADGSYTLLDQPLMAFPVIARRSLSMRALDRLL